MYFRSFFFKSNAEMYREITCFGNSREDLHLKKQHFPLWQDPKVQYPIGINYSRKCNFTF